MTSATARPPSGESGYQTERHGRGFMAFASILLFVIGLNAIGQMLSIPGYPLWSLTIIAMDVVALYGLCTYGSRQNMTA